MLKTFLHTFLFFISFVLLVNAFAENLPEKSVSPKKDVDKQCLQLLRSKNSTQINRCEFFKCFEDRFPCGNKYWVMNWGYKYCRRYADPEFIEKFTDIGKKLLEHVNKCLPKHFEKFYRSKRMVRCKKLNQEAFEAQGKCYTEIQNDFCKAFVDNKDLFIKVLDYNDLMNLESISMIRKATEKCNPKIDFFFLIG